MHMNQCLKYKHGVKHNLSDYKRVPAQLPTGTNQPSISRLQVEGVGGMAPIGEAQATQSRVDGMEEVNMVCIHKPSQPELSNCCVSIVAWVQLNHGLNAANHG